MLGGVVAEVRNYCMQISSTWLFVTAASVLSACHAYRNSQKQRNNKRIEELLYILGFRAMYSVWKLADVSEEHVNLDLQGR
jgi:hypothetical protein